MGKGGCSKLETAMSTHLMKAVLISLFLCSTAALAGDLNSANILCADYQNNYDRTWTTLRPVKVRVTNSWLPLSQAFTFGPSFAFVDGLDLTALLQKKCG